MTFLVVNTLSMDVFVSEAYSYSGSCEVPLTFFRILRFRFWANSLFLAKFMINKYYADFFLLSCEHTLRQFEHPYLYKAQQDNNS